MTPTPADAPEIDLTDGLVPEDTLSARLAIIRAAFDWDYEDAGRECGVGGKNWKRWEREGKLPRDIYDVVRKIHDRTGYSRKWLLDGGPLVRSRWWAPAELRLLEGARRREPIGSGQMIQTPLPFLVAVADN